MPLTDQEINAATDAFAKKFQARGDSNVTTSEAMALVAESLRELTDVPTPCTKAPAGLAQQIRDTVAAGQKPATRTPPSARPSRSGV